ncbi:adenosylhomocysteinase [Streptomyces sp. NPDC004134]|uniref:adenosylhomocysteinase n=1 Tax=Streptomyces sp. NPDC004134 TaxID=3364691 RepID=UPI0036D1AAC1
MPLPRDPALAGEGARKIDFAYVRMPVPRAPTARWAEEKPLPGARIAACLHVTTETASLCRGLEELGPRRRDHLASWRTGT